MISTENSAFWAHVVFARTDILSDAGDTPRKIGGCRRTDQRDRAGRVGGLEAAAENRDKYDFYFIST